MPTALYDLVSVMGNNRVWWYSGLQVFPYIHHDNAGVVRSSQEKVIIWWKTHWSAVHCVWLEKL